MNFKVDDLNLTHFELDGNQSTFHENTNYAVHIDYFANKDLHH